MNKQQEDDFTSKVSAVYEWHYQERKKLDEKYRNSPGIDGHQEEYKAVTTELIKRINDLKNEYGLNQTS